MLVAIDVGNTNITIGVFKHEDLIANYRLTTKIKRTSDEYGSSLVNFLTAAGIDVKDVNDEEKVKDYLARMQRPARKSKKRRVRPHCRLRRRLSRIWRTCACR